MPDAKQEDRDTYNGVVASYYDAAYGSVSSLGPDVDFYAELAARAPGPALELACGTGRVLLELRRRGIACVGLDSSRAMLDALRRKADARDVELVRAQMQAFSLPGRRFGLVYAAFRGFQHLYTVGDQLACLTAAREHLAPGGSFAFDVFVPNLARAAVAHEPEQADLRFRVGDDAVARFVTITRDLPNQLVTVDMRFERTRPDGSVTSEQERIHMRWFHRFELEHLVLRAGYRAVRVHGDFAAGPVTSESRDFVVVGSA